VAPAPESVLGNIHALNVNVGGGGGGCRQLRRNATNSLKIHMDSYPRRLNVFTTPLSEKRNIMVLFLSTIFVSVYILSIPDSNLLTETRAAFSIGKLYFEASV